MSTSADGDGRPDNGGFDELPDLPADWGPVVIPDDPAELAAEAAQVRRELRRAARRATWRRRLRLTSAATTGRTPPRLVLVLLSAAVVAALTSLFAFAWPEQRPAPAIRTTPEHPPVRTLPALDLLGEDGGIVPLRSLLPAMIILADGCPCAAELDAARRTAPPGVTVVVVRTRQTAPDARPTAAPGAGPVPRLLTDPADALRTSLQLATPQDAASAILVSRSGDIIRTLPELTPAVDYQADLARLPTAA